MSSQPLTFLHAGRCATVRQHVDAWLLEWGADQQVVYQDEQRAHIDARLYVFEGIEPTATRADGLIFAERE